LLANVAIATGIGVASLYMFEFGYNADDAFKLLKSINIEKQILPMVEKGIVETEARTWKKRHGLDKKGKKRAPSMYVVLEENMKESVNKAKAATMARLEMVKKAKSRLKDLKRSGAELQDDFVISSDPTYKELETENEEADWVEGLLEEELEISGRKLRESERLGAKIHKEDEIHDAKELMDANRNLNVTGRRRSSLPRRMSQTEMHAVAIRRQALQSGRKVSLLECGSGSDDSGSDSDNSSSDGKAQEAEKRDCVKEMTRREPIIALGAFQSKPHKRRSSVSISDLVASKLLAHLSGHS